MARSTEKKLRALMIRTNMIKTPGAACWAVNDADKQQQLTESIRAGGIVQPLIVSREPLELWYTLVSGRRRLQAAIQLGLKHVPAFVIAAGQAPFTQLCENIYREPPSCFETAKLLAGLIDKLKINDYDSLSDQIGIPPEEIQNKIKLLALGDERIELCRAAGVTQEAANRILTLPKSERDKLFFGLQNPARDIEERAWQLRERLGLDSAETPRRTMAVKDVRIFFNTIEKAIEIMKQAGVNATTERHDYDGLVEYVVKIPSHNGTHMELEPKTSAV